MARGISIPVSFSSKATAQPKVQCAAITRPQEEPSSDAVCGIAVQHRQTTDVFDRYCYPFLYPVVFNGDMEIRPCTDDDLAILSSRWKVLGGVHESHHSGQLAGDTTYLVAWRDGEPLGSGVVQWGGCIGPNAREAFPRAVEINHLQVRDEYRSQGVGTALIAAAEQLIGREGMAQAAVGVADDNPRAERLYLGLGYRRTGIVDVSEYSWVSDDGTVQQASERDQLLVKDLA